MVEDISPKLFNKIIREFDNRVAKDEDLAALMSALPDYRKAHVYAQRLGEHLSAVLRKNITSEVLPNGKLYYNIADSVVRPLLENNRNLINLNAAQVQEALNEAAGIGLRAITPVPDTQRVDGIINRLASEDNFDDVAWLLDEPVKTLSRSFVDEYIKANADFHAKAGLSPRITRTSTGNCCEWCSRLAGTYEYGSPSMPSDIFKRHNRCRCMVLYDPADGRGYQDAHSKKWYDSEEEAQIEQRKMVGIASDDDAIMRQIRNEVIPKQKIDKVVERQEIHRVGTKMYNDRKASLERDGQYGPSYITITDEEILALVRQYSGTGRITYNRKGKWDSTEVILTNDKEIGVVFDNRNGNSAPTTVFKIHYGSGGIHIVPDYPSKKR